MRASRQRDNISNANSGARLVDAPGLAIAERISIIEGLYRVALADGEKSDIEDAYIRHVASLLHIDDISRAQARQAAEKRIADAS